MTSADFAEYSLQEWQEEGLLVAVPRRADAVWLGRRVAKLTGAFTFGASVLLCSTVSLGAHAFGGAASTLDQTAELEPAEQSKDADSVPRGYWASLRKVTEQWPTLPEFDDEAESEPFV
jgi:hypothetical protein